MTINRVLLFFLLTCSSIALASQGQSSVSKPTAAEVSQRDRLGPCAMTLRGQVKDPIGCTLSLTGQHR